MPVGPGCAVPFKGDPTSRPTAQKPSKTDFVARRYTHVFREKSPAGAVPPLAFIALSTIALADGGDLAAAAGGQAALAAVGALVGVGVAALSAKPAGGKRA